METSTAIATAEPAGLENENTKLVGRADWTPDTFRGQVEREKAMRGILAEYMQSAMIENHHYYSFKPGDKPALSQEGAHSIASLLKQTFGPPDITKEIDGDHLTVTVRIQVFSVESGQVTATGDGMCSTRESKYAYRWAWTNELPVGIDKSTLKTRGKKENPQYQLPNQDLPDVWNTVLKMAVKRAKVAAVRQLPLVSELFVAEPEDDDDDRDHAPSNTRTNPENKAKSNGQASAPPPAQQQQPSSVKTVVDLAKKLVENHGVEPTALVEQFLPEDIGRFEDLSEETAAGIAPLLVSLINSKLEEKRSQR